MSQDNVKLFTQAVGHTRGERITIINDIGNKEIGLACCSRMNNMCELRHDELSKGNSTLLSIIYILYTHLFELRRVASSSVYENKELDYVIKLAADSFSPLFHYFGESSTRVQTATMNGPSQEVLRSIKENYFVNGKYLHTDGNSYRKYTINGKFVIAKLITYKDMDLMFEKFCDHHTIRTCVVMLDGHLNGLTRDGYVLIRTVLNNNLVRQSHDRSVHINKDKTHGSIGSLREIRRHTTKFSADNFSDTSERGVYKPGYHHILSGSAHNTQHEIEVNNISTTHTNYNDRTEHGHKFVANSELSIIKDNVIETYLRSKDIDTTIRSYALSKVCRLLQTQNIIASYKGKIQNPMFYA